MLAKVGKMAELPASNMMFMLFSVIELMLFLSKFRLKEKQNPKTFK